jgi:translation initiation factor 1
VSQKKPKLVYSTDRNIPRKDIPAKTFPTIFLPPSEQKVTVRLERKGRGGKSVTIINGLQIPPKEMGFLLKELKGKLGTGGTLKENSLEMQGDRCDAAIDALEKIGYRPKRSGR